jgi:phenylpropionate dioxygenase-like ring-hydroxylating dioxygenase large terminal subunit
VSYLRSPSALQALVEPNRVHSDVYTDPEIFELEMRHLFGRAWQLVGHHGWTFDLRGALVGIPLRDQYGPSFQLEDHALRRVARVATYAGFIFASLSPDGEDLPTFLGCMRENLDNFVDRAPQGTLEVVDHGMKYRYRANWKMVFQNLGDIDHPFYAHRSVANAIKNIDRERLHPLLRTLPSRHSPCPRH